MLIGICGATCAGKDSVADYLVEQLGFQHVSISLAPAQSDGHILQHALSPEANVFPNIDTLLGFVTARWRQRWVLTSSLDEASLEKLLIRPFFLLISIDAPISVRWQRYRARCAAAKIETPAFERFVIQNDEQMFNLHGGLAHFLDRAQLRLLNSSNDLSSLHDNLRSLNLSNGQRLRPSWDEYFMQLADLAAQRSNCMKRRVGCVVVRDKRVVSTGYNGTPRNVTNCNEGGCPRCNGGQGAGAALSTCLCIHAEENALLEAGRERIREGATLYCNTCPCLTCTVKIAQVGITEVIFSRGYNMDKQAAAVLAEAGIQLRQFSPPRNGLVDLDTSSNTSIAAASRRPIS